MLAAIAVVAVTLAAHATTATRSNPGTDTQTDTTVGAATTAVTATATVTTGAQAPTTTAPPPCVEAGPVAIVERGASPQTSALSVASATPAGAEVTAVTYPDDGSILRADSLRVGVAGCVNDSEAPGGTATALAGLNLLGGSVAADSVEADLVPSDATDGSGWHFRAAVRGLRVGARPVSIEPGATTPVGDWGLLRTGARELVKRALGSCAAALELELTQPHAGFPSGTKLLVGYACADRPYAPAPAGRRPSAPRQKAVSGPAPSRGNRAGRRAAPPHPRHPARVRHRGTHARVSRPLRVTPPLGLRGYVFPVAGAASFGDTYGAARSDVSGGWHHGDDIFAPLGTPVVAVASGTLNRVGWERVGGWRLWVRDRLGNEFYYAHLSGYTPSALRSRRVQAGEVIGFIGNTGDAFTTPTHLHFEIHPRTLLHLHYDGAVDPTRYLQQWRRVLRIRAPRPVHPSLPSGPVRAEARDVFRELLAARHVRAGTMRRASRASNDEWQVRADVATGAATAAHAAALPARGPQGSSRTLVEVTAAATSLVLLAAWVLGLRLYRRRSGGDVQSPESTDESGG